MAVIQGRTRKQIRQSIGYNLGALYMGSATGTGTRTDNDVGTLIDKSLTAVIGGNDDHIGKWVVFTSGDNDGDIARVTDYVASTTTITFQSGAGVNIGTATAADDTYELWNPDFPPDRIHDFINQAIMDVTGHAYDPIENVSLHSDGHTLRFDIPSGISMIQNIYYRDRVDSTRLHSCNAAFDEHSTLVVTTLNGAITDAAATSVPVTSASTLRANQQIMVGSEKMTISSISSNTLTVSRGAGGTTAATHSDADSVLMFPTVDTEDKKQGTGANKFVLSASASAGNIITDSITSKDISKYDYLEGWIKITRTNETTTTPADLKIHLDNGTVTADGNDLESLNIPALVDDTWTFFRIKLTNPELDTAIVSVGLEYDVDLGACTIWLDDLSVVRSDTAEWIQVPRNIWRIDKEAADIVFRPYFDGLAPYDLLKIVGGNKPALLTADSTANVIDDSYVVNAATGMAYSSSSGGRDTDPMGYRQQVNQFIGRAERIRQTFPMLTNVRTVN